MLTCLTRLLKGESSKGLIGDAFKPFLPDAVARKTGHPIRVPSFRPRGASTIGTAFDYLFRFEIQRRVPEAASGEWVACCGARLLRSAAADEIVAAAKTEHARFLKLRRVQTRSVAAIAAHAVRLARLDLLARPVGGKYLADAVANATAPPAPEDVAELVDLYHAAPFERFTGERPILLNPWLGLGGVGADADLIVGGLLVDIKTTAHSSNIDVEWAKQLLGYTLLARARRDADPSFPEITRVGVYLSRQGALWTADVGELAGRPDFWSMEAWFRGVCAEPNLDHLPRWK